MRFIITLGILATLLCACSQKQGGEVVETSTDKDSTKTCVMSDDSLFLLSESQSRQQRIHSRFGVNDYRK